MRRKYSVVKDKRENIIDTIINKAVWVAAKILVVNLVQKNQPNQCTLVVIAFVENCVIVTQMNWSLFLLNKLMEDVILEKETKNPFT